jgi:hypothetical protein
MIRRAMKTGGILGGVMVVIVLAGCATAPAQSAPFEQFSAAVQQVRTGADAALGAVYDRSRERYLNEAGAGDVSKVQGLMLTRPPGDPFGWTSSTPPLFLTAAQFREGFYRFNSVLIEYAGALAQITSKDLLDTKAFNALATDLNGNLRSAVQAFGLPPSNREIAIFSTAATAAFEAYLRNQQRSELLRGLRDNQGAIADVAERGAEAIRLTANALRNEYDQKSGALANAAASGSSSSAKVGAMRDLAELDDRFIKEMSVLRALYDTYVSLPRAHRELAAGLEDPKFGFTAIRDMFERGQDLYRRYEELSGKDRGK